MACQWLNMRNKLHLTTAPMTNCLSSTPHQFSAQPYGVGCSTPRATSTGYVGGIQSVHLGYNITELT